MGIRGGNGGREGGARDIKKEKFPKMLKCKKGKVWGKG